MKSFFFKVALSFAVVGAVVACSKSEIEEIAPMQPSTDDIAQEGEVRIAVPEGTRSTLVDNGDGTTDLRWTSGDAIKLVARNASGEDAFAPCVFYFWANTNQIGKSYFRTPSLYGDGKESEPMPEGDYTYYAVSPSTATIEGTTAKFTLPATQNGEFSADVDFMVAKATGKALVACQGEDENGLPNEDTDPVNDLSLVFKHKSHILRFAIPANNLGQKVKKLHMIFPTAVAGTMAVNMDNGAITSTENTSNKITVEFAEPKDAGDEFYVMILPQANVFSKSVDMRFEAVDGTTFSMSHQVNFPQACSEHKLTPVRMSIPQATGVTSFYYTVGTNNLGENLTSMNITLPDGYYFTDFEQTRKASKVDGKYIFSVFNDMLGVVENKTLPFAFESEHALIPQTVTIGDLTDGETTNLGSKNVPYLFEEDFSSIKSYSRDIVTGAQGTVHSAYDLSVDTYGLSSGWTGARTGGEAGKAIRVGGRVDEVWVGTTRTYGRLDSSPITALKPNAEVNVSVSFNYSGGRDGSSKYYPVAICGYVTDSGKIDGSTTVFSDSKSWQNIFGQNEIPNISTSGSFSSITQSMTYTISSCTSAHRLSWQITGMGRTYSISNGNQWMFIDNIRVSIAQ